MPLSRDSSFGALLRHYREAAGLTQEELAERAGLTPSGIGALERGERQRPYPHTVEALATALRLPAEGKAALLAARRGSSPAHPPIAQVVPSLPATLGPIVGRERDSAALRLLLDRADARLITLTGPGGVGKTRLALEVARDVATRFPDGAVFVDLAPLDSATRVIATIAHALGLNELGGQPIRAALSAALRERRLLLLLDNFEHLLPAATEVADLVSTCPGVKVLVTSRAPLRVRSEQEYPVSPLDLPALDAVPSVVEVEESASVQLFVRRAREVAPAFALTRANAAAVAVICRRLDGLPLALELAAARVRMLTPTALLARLDQALPLLTGGARDLPERQQTMLRTIEWSYHLLSDREQQLFRRLSVGQGGWTIDTLEAVCSGSSLEHDLIDLLASLVEQSLVEARVGADGSTRYRMLETVRQYAQRQLEASGEADDARRRHALHILALAEQAESELPGPNQLIWLDQLDVEHDNLRSALSWLLEHGEESAGLRLARALALYWEMRGYLEEGRGWIERAVALTRSPDADVSTMASQARALLGAGWMALFQGDHARAKEQFEESLALYRALESLDGIAHALTYLGFAATLGQRSDIPARDVLAEAIDLLPHVRDRRIIAHIYTLIGLLAVVDGDLPGAVPPHEEGLRICRTIGDRWVTMGLLTNFGILSLALGDLKRGGELVRENLALARETGYRLVIQYCLLSLAHIAVVFGDLARGARLWGAAEAIREANGILIPPLARATTNYDASVAAAREALGETAFAALWAEGRRMPTHEAIQYALASDQSDPPSRPDAVPR
jgi:predicted ATPase/DNA-binding XRE family transcriptional regulator